VVLRARKKGMTRRDKFVVIVATSAKEARNKMEDHLQKKNAMIGSLWFDTHGRYANGYSSFILGKDEFSYKTINDTAKMKDFRALASYCDEWTRVAIGSCYGGATYEKPAHNGKPASRMNGDSLMIGMANLLPTATIYGTEGWVMTKPGSFINTVMLWLVTRYKKDSKTKYTNRFGNIWEYGTPTPLSQRSLR
jgi:hypothetical protein